MGAKKSSWWQQIKQHPVATVLIALLSVVIVLIILSILGYIFNWGWTGLGPYISPPHPKDSDFQRGKTLWDWLQLLIIPAVLAVAGYVINLTISRSEQEATKQRAQSEQEIADDNQRETALQEYVNKMSELLLDGDLCKSTVKDEVQKIARVRTLTVLPRLNGKRKGIVLQFLYEAQLINKGGRIVDLSGADLRGADLSFTTLTGADLKGANFWWARFFAANLKGADLSHAALINSNLEGADLSGADLSEAEPTAAILNGADLSHANLSGADLSEAILGDADLSSANLSGADLSEAGLMGTNLKGADLSGATLNETYLRDAILIDANLGRTEVTEEQLDKAKSLVGATMPDGSIHD